MRGRLVVIVGGLGLCMAGCPQGGELDVRVAFANDELAEAVERLELAVVNTCPATEDLGTQVPDPILDVAILRQTGGSPSLGSLDPGRYALHARGIDGDCQVVAAGCAPFEVRRQGGVASVTLDAAGPFACPGASECSSATLLCVCPAEGHVCDDLCVPDDAPETCGDRCEPCPAPPSNGVAACSAGECTFVCDFGYEPCVDGCCEGNGDLQIVPFGEAAPGLDVAVDATGTVHVVFASHPAALEARYASGKGDAWTVTDDPVVVEEEAIVPLTVIPTGDGGVHIVYVRGVTLVHARREGDAWVRVEVDTLLGGPVAAGAVGPEGRLAVAYLGAANAAVYAEFDGEDWVKTQTPLNFDGVALKALALSEGGDQVVALITESVDLTLRLVARTWTAPDMVTSVEMIPANAPSDTVFVRLDGEDQPYAYFVDEDGRYMEARPVGDDTWALAVVEASPKGTTIGDSDIWVSADGSEAIFVDGGDQGGATEPISVLRRVGDEWSPYFQISFEAQAAGLPTLAVDASGDLHFAYLVGSVDLELGVRYRLQRRADVE